MGLDPGLPHRFDAAESTLANDANGILIRGIGASGPAMNAREALADHTKAFAMAFNIGGGRVGA